MTRECPKCHVLLPFTATPDGLHHGFVRCPQHGHRWVVTNPTKTRRRKVSIASAEFLFGPKLATFCWLCLTTDCALELHHIVEVAQGGTDDAQNLQVLCVDCHALTHRLRRQRKTSRAITDAQRQE